jgi:hypothetical protein
MVHQIMLSGNSLIVSRPKPHREILWGSNKRPMPFERIVMVSRQKQLLIQSVDSASQAMQAVRDLLPG